MIHFCVINFFIFLIINRYFLKDEKKYTSVIQKWSRSVSGAHTVSIFLIDNKCKQESANTVHVTEVHMKRTSEQIQIHTGKN